MGDDMRTLRLAVLGCGLAVASVAWVVAGRAPAPDTVRQVYYLSAAPLNDRRVLVAAADAEGYGHEAEPGAFVGARVLDARRLECGAFVLKLTRDRPVRWKSKAWLPHMKELGLREPDCGGGG